MKNTAQGKKNLASEQRKIVRGAGKNATEEGKKCCENRLSRTVFASFKHGAKEERCLSEPFLGARARTHPTMVKSCKSSSATQAGLLGQTLSTASSAVVLTAGTALIRVDEIPTGIALLVSSSSTSVGGAAGARVGSAT